MTAQLIDGFGRVHTDLRISVTDRCNFRCTYCMPEEGMEWLPRSEVLTFEEIERLAAIFVQRFGVRSIRLTGGEPTLRAHLPVLIARLAALRTADGDAIDLAMTTNGATLSHQADSLRQAGLRRINVSLDTLDRQRFIELTRRDELARVIEGIDAAVAAGFDPVKVNCVVMAGVNDDEIVDLARFGRDRGVELRFIEFMPLDADGQWRADDVVSQTQILERLSAVFPLEEAAGSRTNEPAERFRYLDSDALDSDALDAGASVPGGSHVGVIASVTRPFCQSCDRVRLSPDGGMRNCLFALGETDLRGPIRAGATDDELADIMMGNVAEKWAGHAIGQVQFIRPRKSMSQIGG